MYCIQIKLPTITMYLRGFDHDTGQPMVSDKFAEALIYTSAVIAKIACKNCQDYYQEAIVVNA
jgi:hypothetical protein